MATARAFGMKTMNRSPLEGLDGVLNKARFVKRIGVDCN